MANLGIYATGRLLRATKEMEHKSTFLKDTFFPTGPDGVFNNGRVFFDWQDDDRRMAPVVAERSGGIEMGREGIATWELEPPHIAPARSITTDHLKERGFGEALYGEYTEAQRAARMAVDDLQKLDDYITRREEWMCAQTLINNGCEMKEYTDDHETGRTVSIKFYDPSEGNQAVFTPTKTWDDHSALIINDLFFMARELTSRGKPATTLLVASDVALEMQENEQIQRFLDNRRYELGEVAPRFENYPTVAHVMRLNALGHFIDVITYDETYRDDTGKIQPYIPNGTAIMLSEGCGETLYGAVTQMDYGEIEFKTYAGTRIPKFSANSDDNSRKLVMQSRPVCVPSSKDPWITATEVLG